MTTPPPLDLNHIQGDIFDGLPKKVEVFFFFVITNAATFRTQLATVIPHITTFPQSQGARKKIDDAKKKYDGKPPSLIPMSAANISFSKKGLLALGITESTDDAAFEAGQLANATPILNDNLAKWDEDFKKPIHGLIIVTGDCNKNVDHKLGEIKKLFKFGEKGAGITEVTHLVGHVRPGKEDGHEHFGFNDGLGQPAVKGVTDVSVLPGVETINQGVILIGREMDDGTSNPGGSPLVPVKRPSWTLDGSFLAFRYLKQLVPEFDQFLEQNALPVAPPRPGSGDPTGAELLGARLVGRWKSGAPVDATPLKDNPALAAPDKNQVFRFDPKSQERCPFAAHIRKTNPRDDLNIFGGTEIRRIIRRGIQFGPEVTPKERQEKKSSPDEKLERGLLFACYQSNLRNGFEFIQEQWVSNAAFPPGKDAGPNMSDPPVTITGLDPIIGEPGLAPNNLLQMVGSNPDKALALEPLKTIEFVVPRGGEYFFVPSLPVLKSKIAGISAAQQEL